MLLRFAALCVFAVSVTAVEAQQSPPPGSDVAFPTTAAPDERDVPGPPQVQDVPPAGQPSRAPGDDRRLPQAERWGAVAYTADGAFGAAYGIDTEQDAERLAIAECMKESTDKADCSRGVMKGRDTWFHIQFCRRDREWSTHVTARSTLSEVNQAAAKFAEGSRYGSNNCRLVPNGLFHSGGLHTKM